MFADDVKDVLHVSTYIYTGCSLSRTLIHSFSGTNDKRRTLFRSTVKEMSPTNNHHLHCIVYFQ